MYKYAYDGQTGRIERVADVVGWWMCRVYVMDANPFISC